MNVRSSQLAKLLLKTGWDTNPTLAAQKIIQSELLATDKQAARLYSQVLESGLVVQEWGKREGSIDAICRWVLAPGITEEML